MDANEERFDFWKELEIQKEKDQIGDFPALVTTIQQVINTLEMSFAVLEYSHDEIHLVTDDLSDDEFLVQIALKKLGTLEEKLAGVRKAIIKLDKFMAESREKEFAARKKIQEMNRKDEYN